MDKLNDSLTKIYLDCFYDSLFFSNVIFSKINRKN